MNLREFIRSPSLADQWVPKIGLSLLSTVLELQMWAVMLISFECWGIELRSSYLHGSNFTDWNLSLGLKLYSKTCSWLLLSGLFLLCSPSSHELTTVLPQADEIASQPFSGQRKKEKGSICMITLMLCRPRIMSICALNFNNNKIKLNKSIWIGLHP